MGHACTQACALACCLQQTGCGCQARPALRVCFFQEKYVPDEKCSGFSKGPASQQLRSQLCGITSPNKGFARPRRRGARQWQHNDEEACTQSEAQAGCVRR